MINPSMTFLFSGSFGTRPGAAITSSGRQVCSGRPLLLTSRTIVPQPHLAVNPTKEFKSCPVEIIPGKIYRKPWDSRPQKRWVSCRCSPQQILRFSENDFGQKVELERFLRFPSQ